MQLATLASLLLLGSQLLSVKGFNEQDAEGECPDDWIGSGESCYWVSNYEYTWDDAKAKCAETENGHLVEINDETENSFVAELIDDPDEDYHIGLFSVDDAEENIEFEWVNGDKLDFEAWDEGEPL